MSEAAFRTRLGTPLIGTFLKSASYQAAELLALAGLDCLMVDAEHAPFGRADLDRIALAARSAGCPALVRMPAINPGLINICLDLGTAGIVVPHVRWAQDARDAVSAATYAGRRGFLPSTRAAGYGTRGAAAHRAQSDHAVTVWAQIEDRHALDHLDAIASVDWWGWGLAPAEAFKRKRYHPFFPRRSIRTACCQRLGALSVRWMQPAQQQGRFFPCRTSSRVRAMRRRRVADCFASSTQQMNSFRPSGVRLSQSA